MCFLNLFFYQTVLIKYCGNGSNPFWRLSTFFESVQRTDSHSSEIRTFPKNGCERVQKREYAVFMPLKLEKLYFCILYIKHAHHSTVLLPFTICLHAPPLSLLSIVIETIIWSFQPAESCCLFFHFPSAPAWWERTTNTGRWFFPD